MSNIVKVLPESNQDIMLALKNSVYPGAKDESIAMVLSYCRAAGLDPIQKPVHIVPMWDKNSGQMRDVVMPGIGLYRTQASRSETYAGSTEPEFGPDVSEEIGGVKITYPQWCRVTVKRLMSNGAIAEFTAREFWKENYAVKGGKEKSIAPNAMWSKRAYGQLAKCTEAQALRKAFPELGSAPTAEEMEGKIIEMGDAEIEPQEKKTVTQPQSKSEPKPAPKPEDDGPIGDGPKRIIKAKLEAGALSEVQLCEKFAVKSIDEIKRSQINDVLAWLANPNA